MMNAYEWINSKDIAQHLDKIKYDFTGLEYAWLIWQKKGSSLLKRHYETPTARPTLTTKSTSFPPMSKALKNTSEKNSFGAKKNPCVCKTA